MSAFPESGHITIAELTDDGPINSVVDKSLPKFVIRYPAHILFSEPLVSMVAYEIVDEVRNEWRNPEKAIVKKRPCAI
jgi:hypothetical protein